jgi:hypothetical protein
MLTDGTDDYSFEFERAEYVRANRTISKHALRVRWQKYLVRTVLWVFGIGMTINVWADFQRGRFPAVLPALILLASLPLIPTLNGIVAARQWEKLNPAGHRQMTVGVGEEGFRTASYIGRTELRWAAMKQVIETDEFFLFYVTGRIAYYLPKRVVPEVQLSPLRNLVRARVGSELVHLDDREGAA